ncbi:ABC transporter permease [Rhizorhabdus sp. FW153]|uniref:ABC transporter permease n=1 Tax=Rhizorhabdus sp. FW153 TaxID=3400216 RepID=UPI003CE91EB2
MTAVRSSFYDDLTHQMNVVGALVLRELHTRFGRNNIGYLWMIGEPMMLATVVGAIHAFQPGHLGSTIPPVALSVVGYCIFIIFRGVFNRAESIIESNLPLMYHRMVSVLNLSIARVVVETAGCVTTFIILYSLLILLGFAQLPARPLYAMGGIAMMVWISFALGLNVTAVTFERPTLQRLVHPISYFMMPLSGAFFVVDWLPPALQKALDWIPMVNIFEIIRYGMFEVASSQHLYPGYAVAWCAVFTYTGLLGIRRLRKRIHVR